MTAWTLLQLNTSKEQCLKVFVIELSKQVIMHYDSSVEEVGRSTFDK